VNTNIKDLLRNPEIKHLAKEILAAKQARYDLLGLKWRDITQKVILEQIGVNETSIRLCFDLMVEREEMQVLKRTISRLSYQLNNLDGKGNENKEWDEMYRYATELVTIDKIINRVLGIPEFNRNIKCPFHGEDKSPSLHVYSKNNFWICFACQRKGGPIQFIQEMNNCTFKEAVVFINNLK